MAEPNGSVSAMASNAAAVTAMRIMAAMLG
jgi:hypothetical protein